MKSLGEEPQAIERPAIERVRGAHCRLGESPTWSATDGCLYWIDVEAGVLWRLDPDGQARVEATGLPGIGALTVEVDGRVALYLPDGRTQVRPGGQEGPRVRVAAGTRFNDAVCDRRGRVYCGVMPVPGRRGSLVCLEAGRDPVAVADLLLPNGAGFSPDGGTFYVGDSLRRCIYAAPFNEATGTIGPLAVFARVPREDGFPDGLAIDRRGGIWSARHGSGVLVRHDASGDVTHRVQLPTLRPTGIAFGGDELRFLYVTSAHADGDRDAGGLFRVDCGFTGAPTGRSRLFG